MLLRGLHPDVRAMTPDGYDEAGVGSRERRAAAAAAAIGAGGLVTLRLGFGPFETQAGVLAVTTGWIVAGCGLIAWLRTPASRVGPLLVAVAVAWLVAGLQRTPLGLLNDVAAPLQLAYAPLLAHAVLLAHADGRPILSWIAVGLAYAFALLLPQPAAGLATSASIAVGLGTACIVRPRARSAAAWPTIVGVFFAITLGGVTFGRWFMPSLAGIDLRPALEIALILTAGSLSATVVRAGRLDLRVAELVIELGREPGGGFARQLSTLLGDPSLEVVFALDGEGRYVSANGRDITLPGAGSGRAVTLIDHDGRPVAALLHDPATRVDPGVRTAITAAAELAGSNARLQVDVQRQLAEVAASRRRLLDAADEERRSLRTQLDLDLGPQLDELEATLLGRQSAVDRAAVADAVEQVRETRADVAALAEGLHPRRVEELGLVAALEELARRSAVPVQLSVGRVVEGDLAALSALYFVCSEALANAAKYADATAISMRLEQRGQLLVAAVEDDGIGGADAARGTGLAGLRDRIEALGGWLTVSDGTDNGTRVVAAVPSGVEPPRPSPGDGETQNARPLSRS